MKRSGGALMILALSAAAALASCGPPGAQPSSSGADPAASTAGAVDEGVQQRVKNLCLDRLKAEVSGASAAAPGQLRAAPKVTLVSVKYLGDIRAVPLPNGASGYELGIEFGYQMGHDDSQTATKFCRANLTDSTVDWKWTASP
ncbi:hypothetical protein [Arthrobacter sp. NPDC057013]|uniref:hypothetical protein n=1 Tax=Arthrobacter sp. NPDC057013 TaxID=3345999 RepID=UPI00363092F1